MTKPPHLHHPKTLGGETNGHPEYYEASLDPEHLVRPGPAHRQDLIVNPDGTITDPNPPPIPQVKPLSKEEEDFLKHAPKHPEYYEPALDPEHLVKPAPAHSQDRIEALQEMLAQGDSPEARALAEALQHGGKGVFGPKTHAALKAAFEQGELGDAGSIDVKNMSSENFELLLEQLKAKGEHGAGNHVSWSNNQPHGTGLILEDDPKPHHHEHGKDQPHKTGLIFDDEPTAKPWVNPGFYEPKLDPEHLVKGGSYSPLPPHLQNTPVNSAFDELLKKYNFTEEDRQAVNGHGGNDKALTASTAPKLQTSKDVGGIV